MIYSNKDLLSIIKNPIQHDKWGDDTRTVVSLLKSISDANCTACQLRKHLSRLKTILNKYGDDIVYTSSDRYLISGSDRVPCPECVAKHLSQAYVLQSEFYQGYTEYFDMIESHIKEAIDECPSSNAMLKELLKNIWTTLVIDHKPDIPLPIFDIIPTNKTEKSSEYNTTVSNQTQSTQYNCNLSNAGLFVLTRVHRLLSVYAVTKDEIKNVADTNTALAINSLGYLAQASELLASSCNDISIELRERRIKIRDNIIGKTIDNIDPIWLSNCDILDLVNKCIKMP